MFLIETEIPQPNRYSATFTPPYMTFLLSVPLQIHGLLRKSFSIALFHCVCVCVCLCVCVQRGALSVCILMGGFQACERHSFAGKGQVDDRSMSRGVTLQAPDAWSTIPPP